MARTPKKDSSVSGGGGDPPQLNPGDLRQDIGTYGLRAYSGYVREEFLPQLIGREAQRVYREMLDNSSVVGSLMFAITQAMRRVTWRVEPANDTAPAKQAAEFVESLMTDMSHTWEDFVNDALSMLGYGFSAHEIVYKRRNGRQPARHQTVAAGPATSRFDDGKIGWRRLPSRGQDTILKWFFNVNGGVLGLTQQPYTSVSVDIPMEKLLLFRPMAPKNNPEGRSILRNAFTAYDKIKRLETLEAISVERFNGFPVLYLPSELIQKAQGPNADPIAVQALNLFDTYLTNIRVHERMGMRMPSDVFMGSDGKPSGVRKYELQFLTPAHGAGKSTDTDKIITRYTIQILMIVLADFIQMGHEVRGTNNLAVTKVDMFYQAIEGWLNSMAAVMNRFALPRLWRLNGDDLDLMPQFKPDMSQRLDLDSLGAYVTALSTAGMPMFPDDDLQTFLREAGGMPEITAPEAMAAAKATLDAATRPPPAAAAANVRGKGAVKKKPKAAPGD